MSTEDVRLCSRRSPSLLQFITEHGEKLKAQKEELQRVVKEGGGKEGEGNEVKKGKKGTVEGGGSSKNGGGREEKTERKEKLKRTVEEEREGRRDDAEMGRKEIKRGKGGKIRK